MIFKEAQGFRVPAIGLSTWRMRGQECQEAVQVALELGYKYIDTGQYYRNASDIRHGINDSDVERDDIFVALKVSYTHENYREVINATLETFTWLQMDYIDLVLIHWPEKRIPLQTILSAMQELRNRGKIGGIGVSNFPPNLLDEALRFEPGIVMNQVEMHPYYQQYEMKGMCIDEGILLCAYDPLARGRITKDEVLNNIADKYNKSPAQIALRWAIQQQNVVAVPKAVPEQYQQENIRAMDFELDNEDMERIYHIDKEQSFTYPGFAFW